MIMKFALFLVVSSFLFLVVCASDAEVKLLAARFDLQAEMAARFAAFFLNQRAPDGVYHNADHRYADSRLQPLKLSQLDCTVPPNFSIALQNDALTEAYQQRFSRLSSAAIISVRAATRGPAALLQSNPHLQWVASRKQEAIALVQLAVALRIKRVYVVYDDVSSSILFAITQLLSDNGIHLLASFDTSPLGKRAAGRYGTFSFPSLLLLVAMGKASCLSPLLISGSAG